LENYIENEKIYQLFVEKSHDIIYSIDLNGYFTYANPVAERIIGWPRSEIVGKHYLSFVRPDFHERIEAFYKKQHDDRAENTYFEYPVITRDGQTKWIGQNVQLLTKKEKIVGFHAIARDITDRIKAEEALRESEKKYKLLAEMMTDIVWTADINLRTTYVSPSIKTVLGISPEERMAQDISEQITPESMSVVLDAMSRELAIERDGHGDPERILTIELEYYHKDGSTRWLENIIRAIRDDTGVLIGLHGVSRDVTERRKIQEELRESEAMLRSYLENAPDGIYLSDFEGRFLYGNRKSEEIIGYRREDVIGKSYLELNLLSEKSLGKALQLLRVSMEGKPTGPDEIELINKEGRTIPVEINASIIECKGHKTILGFVRDVTYRKHIEEALRQSEKSYRELVDFLPISIFEMDRAGNIITGNQAIFEMFGYVEEDLEKGINVFQSIVPDHRERLKMNIQRVLNGEKIGGSEYLGIRKNGSTFPLITYTSPIVREDKPVGLRGALIDLTNQKWIEESLRRSNFSLAQAQRIAHMGNWEWDIESGEVFWSEEIYRILGTSSQMFVMTYRSFIESVFPDDREIVRRAINKSIIDRTISEIEHRIVRRDGVVREVYERIEPVTDDKGKIVKIIGVLQDITEKKRTERDLQNAREQLLQSEKLAAMGRLSAGVAHEILNPVSIIFMELQLLQNMKNLSPEIQEELKVCVAQINRIVTIAENLKQFSRIPETKMIMFNIKDIIANVLKIYATQLKIEGIETKVHCKSDLPLIAVDKEKIEQVFINLITNAAAAMEGKEKKLLTITIDRKVINGDRDFIQTVVADTGTGIKNEHMMKIFDPFFTTKQQGKGTGLGLSISYGIINDHGGNIWAENNEEGGASFYVMLPVKTVTGNNN